MTSKQASPTAQHVFALAWPMTLKAIMLHGTVVIDGYLVSSLGEVSLAAMGLAAATAGLVLGAILAFSGAMQIRAAQAQGTGDPVFIKSTLVAGLVVSVSIAVIGLFLLLVFGQSLLAALAPSDEVAALAQSYLMVFSLVVLGESVGQCLSSYFNGCGQSRVPLYSFCLSVPVNILASIILIHGHLGLPAFGVMGAAMGSAIAITLQVGFLLYRLIRDSGHLFKVAGWRQATFLLTVKRYLLFSLPIAATFFSATLSTHVCTLIYAKLSINEFAAMTLIAPWIMVAGTVGMQWAQAAGILVAQLLGQQLNETILDRFLSKAWRGAFVAAAVVALIFLGVCLSADVLYADLSRETRAILLSFLPVLLLVPFPKGSNAICGNTLRASGDTIYVMHIFIWSQWLFRVPATYVVVIYFDVAAVWVLSIALWEELLKFIPFHRRLLSGRWKHAVITD